MTSGLERTRFLNIINYRREIEAGNIEPALERLTGLQDRDTAMALRQGVYFIVDGYNDDPRELWEIPEVRHWIALLDARWPYWFFYLYPGHQSSLGFITFSLCPIVHTAKGPDVENKAFGEFLNRHYEAMNRISEWLGDSQEENARMTNSITAYYTGIDESAVDSEGLKLDLLGRQDRAAAAIEICERNLITLLPELLATLDKMTWGEIEEVSPHITKLGPQAVEPLCALLFSNRKQTATAVTDALAAIGDARACLPLVNMMLAQAGDTNSIRARDALIQLGAASVPAVMSVLDSPSWTVRQMAVQCLGAIGDESARERLEDISISDRSTKVREAAEEALDALST